MAGVASSSRQRSKIAPYLMILPALAYLTIFFVVPLFSLARTSLSTAGGSVYLPTLTFDWNVGNFTTRSTNIRIRSCGRSATRPWRRWRACCWLSRWPT